MLKIRPRMLSLLWAQTPLWPPSLRLKAVELTFAKENGQTLSEDSEKSNYKNHLKMFHFF